MGLAWSKVPHPAVALVAGPAITNTITFVNQDNIPRTIHNIAAAGHAEVPEQALPAHGNVTVTYPHGWNGAFRTVAPDQQWFHPSVRGEWNFNAFEGKTFWDLEAINGPNDQTGLHWCYAANTVADKWNGSGCDTFPCPTAFRWATDDNPVETPGRSNHRVNMETQYICFIGGHDGVTYHGQ